MKNYIYYIFLIACIQLKSSPVSVTCGGTGISSAVAYAVICGGTSSIGSLQTTASAGSSGQPLISAGAGALPAYGTLSIGGGGTGATSLSAGVIQSNGSVLSSLGIGSSGQTLKNSAGTVGWSFTNVLQVVSTSTSSFVNTSGTSIPNDDTIPQFSEGTLIVSASITPKSSSSNLLIIFSTGGTSGATTAAITALFVDSGANAIAAQYISSDASTLVYSGSLIFVVASGSTSARTYQIRVGGGDLKINGTAASRSFGGVASTPMIIIEVV